MNAKKKGNAGENAFANWLHDNGIKAWKDGASGGGNRNKGDVNNNINAHFEVKTVKKINLQEAWRQAERDASLTHNTPYVVIHFDGMPKDSWLMVMNSWDWLQLVKKPQEERIEAEVGKDSRSLKYSLEKALYALKGAIKEVESYQE